MREGRRRFFARAAAVTAGSAAAFALPKSARADKPVPFAAKLERTRILYVVIDRPADALPEDHAPNTRGLAVAASSYDPALQVTVVTVDELMGMDAQTLDATYKPLAIYGAGSFSEWFMYGIDADWRGKLDSYMRLIRSTTIPMLAVCGSHQLVAIAFNGFSAVAHMTAGPSPVRISEELSMPTPRGLWPNPRPGEEGTYPVIAASAAETDDLVRATTRAPWAASHHKDMVVDTSGFALIYQGDDGRAPATTAGDQVPLRCRVQAMRRLDPGRILYSTQFHPEMTRFDESTMTDGGFGKAWMASFLRLARSWWDARSPDVVGGQ